MSSTVPSSSAATAGKIVIVGSEETCTAYGMPRGIEEAGLADGVSSLDGLPEAIAREAEA